MVYTNCPQCGSSKLVSGTLVAHQGGVFFKYEMSWARYFKLGMPYLDVGGPANVCLDCGLLWTSVNGEELRRKIEKWGSAEAKARLDAQADNG